MAACTQSTLLSNDDSFFEKNNSGVVLVCLFIILSQLVKVLLGTEYPKGLGPLSLNGSPCNQSMQT